MSQLPAILPPRPPAVPEDLKSVIELGTVLAQSGYFDSARSAAQAVVKILAGRELGFPAIASMTGIHIIEGKPSIGSNLLASAIRDSGKYDYEILEHTDQVCAIRFKRLVNGAWVNLEPVERITLAEAQAKKWHLSNAGKVKSPWEKAPKNMLFARALTNGQKFHCPNLFSGMLVYDPDELDADVSAPTNSTPHQTASPAPVPEGPRPNVPPPATVPGLITEEEYQQLVTLIREQRWLTGQVMTLCQAVGIPALQKLPRERLTWATQAVKTGFAPTAQVDRIMALIGRLNLDPMVCGQKLQQTYGVSSFGHLLPGQADEVEQKLRAAETAAKQQPAPAA